MTVVPLHKVLQAVKQRRWKAPAGRRELAPEQELEIWVHISVRAWDMVESFA